MVSVVRWKIAAVVKYFLKPPMPSFSNVITLTSGGLASAPRTKSQRASVEDENPIMRWSVVIAFLVSDNGVSLHTLLYGWAQFSATPPLRKPSSSS